MGFIDNVRNLFSKGSSNEFMTIHGYERIGKNENYKWNNSDSSYGIDKGYAANTDVFSIINLIKNKAVDIPLNLYRVTGDSKELITEGEVFDFLNNPNEHESLKEFNEYALMYYLATGNSVVHKDNEFAIGGRVTQLKTMHYPCVSLETMTSEMRVVPKLYNYHIGDKQYDNISPEDIIHVRYANPTSYGINSYCGLSPLQAGFLTLIGSNNLNVADASILKNKGAAGVFSNESEVMLNPEQRKRAQQALDKLIAGSDKFGKIIQSPVKTKYTQLGMSPADLKILESRVMKKRDLCSLYSIDSSLINDPANTTYNNRREAQKALYTNAVIPVVNRVLVDGIWNPVLKTWSDERSKYVVEQDLTEVNEMHQDKQQKATIDKTTNEIIINTLSAETMTPNQKIQALSISLGISEDEAKNIVQA